MATVQRETALVVISDPQINFLLDRFLRSAGFNVVICPDTAVAKKELAVGSPALMILGEKLSDAQGLDFATVVLRQYPAVPIILFVSNDTPDLLKAALRLGVSEYLCLPLKAEDILKAVQNSLTKARLRKEWVLLEARRATTGLQKKLDEVEALTRLGRTVTGSLDLDSVLEAVVDAAVELTGAEEGSLLLLDLASGELYMRAARNFQEEFVRKFRLPIQDTLAGSVLRTGQPVILDENTPQKIKTSYLVHSLAYVPLQSKDQVIGVLGVDNRLDRKPLSERDIKMLSALAEYAVIAIDNAALYSSISQERNKLDTILNHIQDGVMVIDQDQRLLFANRAAQEVFDWTGELINGQPYEELIELPVLLDLVRSRGKEAIDRAEITLEDGRVFNALINSIPEVGLVVTLHDITNLKKLDHIKSDFVATVSHDLRSPLTAILGYVELIERVGTINDTQKEYIHRIHTSVHNITSLVDDLLNLGRIEAGFDTRKETVHLDHLIRFAVESIRKQAEDKNHQLVLELPESFPPFQANPVQIRQMVDNLLDNAIKYTLPGGVITLRLSTAQKQVILQIQDNGIGIPSVDIPYIFDRFYRASNASADISGTGLGLAIVKSIVESHNGRIWVESTVGHGATFTVVLQLSEV
jgi:two-component system phosphate regulon sensor histidine kinase PhoR